MLRFEGEEVELVYESDEGICECALSETTTTYEAQPLTYILTCHLYRATYCEHNL
jgi:hypothetical protein